MRSSVEPVEGTAPKKVVKLSVEVDEKEFEVALDAAFRRIAREVRIPGFRPGKAPRRVLEARIGPGYARKEALREALPGYYVEAVRENGVDAIAQPDFELTGGEESGPVTFDATVEVRPLVPIDGYGGLVVTVPPLVVTDDEVDRQIDRLRSAEAELLDVDRPARDGDVLTIDLLATRTHGSDEGSHEDTLDDVSDYTYELGNAPGFPPEVAEALTGATPGDERVFDAAVGTGGDVHFTIAVKRVQEKQLPPLTDEWAAEASELETVAALRDDLRQRLQSGRLQGCQMAFRDGSMAALLALVDEELVPDALIAEEVNRRANEMDQNLRRGGRDLEKYAESVGGIEVVASHLRQQARPAVKVDLALRALAEAEGLTADDDDVERELGLLAPQLGQSVAQLRRSLERNDGMQAVRSDVRKAKALDWLMEHVEVNDTEGNPVDREALRTTDAPSSDDQSGDDQSGHDPSDTEE